MFEILKYIRWNAFDISTDIGRAEERYRLAFYSIIVNILSKSVSMAVMVFSIRWTIPYLGKERFGVWMTIVSFVGVLTFLDLGIGNSLTNRVAKVAALNEKSILIRSISGGLSIMLIIGLFVGVFLSITALYFPWQILFKVNNKSIYVEIYQALIVFSIMFGINIFATGIQKVFVGLQRSFEVYAFSIIGSLCSLISLWFITDLKLGISVLLIVTFGFQTISNLLLLFLLLYRNLFKVNGIIFAIKEERSSLLKVGGLFFMLQIATMVCLSADNLLIVSTLGAAQVAIYTVTQRLFQIVSQPLAIINSPLWAAYADAYVRGDNEFIRKTLKKSMLFTSMFSIVIGYVLVYFNHIFLGWLTKDSIIVPFSFVLIYYIWTLFEALGNSFAMMLNGLGIIKPQVLSTLLFLFIAIPLKLYLVKSGIIMLVTATILSYAISVPIYYYVIYTQKPDMLKILK